MDQVTDIRLEIEEKKLKKEEKKKLEDENAGAREKGRESSQLTFAIKALFSEKSIADIGGVSRCTQTCTTGEEEKRRI